MKYVIEAIKLLWPSVVLAGIWIAVSLASFWYARTTRRPIFVFSGVAALFMMVGEVLSPARIAYHYISGIHIPGGVAGRVEVLVGAYKYQIAIEAVGAVFFLVGIFRE